MDRFQRRGANLYCEEIPLKELALQFGTPLYVYSYNTLHRHFKALDESLAGVDHLICYSVKANGNGAILRALASWGAGADIVSGGELFRSLRAGIPSGKIVFSGVGKSAAEIEYALRRRVLMINVESQAEMIRVAAAAQRMGIRAPIGVRLNPDIDPRTHPYVVTGARETKFGLSAAQVAALWREASGNAHLECLGLSFHIGSQVTEIGPFREAVESVLKVAREVRGRGGLRYLDCGGGLGVRYLDEEPPDLEAYAKVLAAGARELGCTLLVEPGRILVANAGVLVTRVILVKEAVQKRFVVVDAGMNDLLRPSLYGAAHAVVPVTTRGRDSVVADLVGPLCEAADFLAKDREIEEPFEGDSLCIRTAGAYGFAMSSQYNSRPRAAEVLVRGEKVALIRRRETFDDLVEGEEIPPWLEGAA